MDELQKVYGALGLCRRAGKCLAGDFAVERALKAGRAGLVVLDTEVSDATRERYQALCERRGAVCLFLPDMGRAIGKPAAKIAAVTDQRFAHMILCAHARSKTEKQDVDPPGSKRGGA